MLKLFVTLSTTTLQNSSLSVDFGDGSSITAALQPGVALATNNTQAFSVHGSDRGLVSISRDNYRLTCQLFIEISHIYMSEGDFNISAVVQAAVLGDTIRAHNWTTVIVQLSLIHI